ncbi:hypothetical protein [Gaetbulibacter aestuarii]|uniref:Uncharacterized protein n=1 Tax=Gaetbulibacter aestuarii TaxID=1502358 RepID=A0ABW7MW36_9FLAO
MKNWCPEKVPINRDEDYHTHYLGELEDGKLFFGCETFVFPKGFTSNSWQNERLEYVVVYLFDNDGNHIDTLFKLLGKSSDVKLGQSEHSLKSLLEPLGKLKFRNIEIKPFSTHIDGIKFGLIPNPETQSIELQPSSTISFFEPWDGEYFT